MLVGRGRYISGTDKASIAGFYFDHDGAFSLWFNPNFASNDNTQHILFLVDGGGAKLFFCDKFSDNTFRCGWYNAGTNRLHVISNGSYPWTQGAYHHLLFWYTGVGSNESKLWLNGSLMSTVSNNGDAMWN